MSVTTTRRSSAVQMENTETFRHFNKLILDVAIACGWQSDSIPIIVENCNELSVITAQRLRRSAKGGQYSRQ